MLFRLQVARCVPGPRFQDDGPKRRRHLPLKLPPPPHEWLRFIQEVGGLPRLTVVRGHVHLLNR